MQINYKTVCTNLICRRETANRRQNSSTLNRKRLEMMDGSDQNRTSPECQNCNYGYA